MDTLVSLTTKSSRAALTSSDSTVSYCSDTDEHMDESYPVLYPEAVLLAAFRTMCDALPDDHPRKMKIIDTSSMHYINKKEGILRLDDSKGETVGHRRIKGNDITEIITNMLNVPVGMMNSFDFSNENDRILYLINMSEKKRHKLNVVDIYMIDEGIKWSEVNSMFTDAPVPLGNRIAVILTSDDEPSPVLLEKLNVYILKAEDRLKCEAYKLLKSLSIKLDAHPADIFEITVDREHKVRLLLDMFPEFKNKVDGILNDMKCQHAVYQFRRILNYNFPLHWTVCPGRPEGLCISCHPDISV